MGICLIINDFIRALGQLGDPRFRSVLVKGVGLSLGLLALIYAIFLTVIGWFVPDQITLPIIGTITWVDSLISWGSAVLMIILSVFLMVPVASAFTGIFLDDVTQAVEDRHYPGHPSARRIPLGENIRDSLRFLGVMIAANLLALLLYLVFSPLAPLIFWALNGFLLGREYFQMVAMRRLDTKDARELRKRHSVAIWIAGTLMAVPLTLPLINLLVPVLGVATFTHLYHRLQPGRP